MSLYHAILIVTRKEILPDSIDHQKKRQGERKMADFQKECIWKKDSLYQVVREVQNFPGWIILKGKSLDALEHFLCGYMYAGSRGNVDAGLYPPRWYKRFQNYVIKQLIGNLGYAGNVFSAIKSVGFSDQEGFDYFYSLLDQFELYEQNIWTRVQKECEIVKENEGVIVLKLDEDAIFEIVDRYIDEHTRDIFYMVGGTGVHTRFEDAEKMTFTHVICGSVGDSDEKLREMSQRIPATTDSLFEEVLGPAILKEHPYRVIRWDEKKV